MSKTADIAYRFFPSLLDSYQRYLSSSDIWETYYMDSSKPDAPSEEEFSARCYQELLDCINRRPVENEYVFRGRCFNAGVDYLLGNRDEEYIYEETGEGQILKVAIAPEGPQFEFPLGICRQMASIVAGGLPQVYCEAPLSTRYGSVLLYGVLDELLPMGVHDIKTTTHYRHGAYFDKWQRFVYPYCLTEAGNKIDYFEYDIVVITGKKKHKYHLYREYYPYQHEDSIQLLTYICESLIEFIEANRTRITNLKIFNYGETSDSALFGSCRAPIPRERG